MEMKIEILTDFEIHLDPSEFSAVPADAELIGYGGISAIFKLRDIPFALKRLPRFYL